MRRGGGRDAQRVRHFQTHCRAEFVFCSGALQRSSRDIIRAVDHHCGLICLCFVCYMLYDNARLHTRNQKQYNTNKQIKTACRYISVNAETKHMHRHTFVNIYSLQEFTQNEKAKKKTKNMTIVLTVMGDTRFVCTVCGFAHVYVTAEEWKEWCCKNSRARPLQACR